CRRLARWEWLAALPQPQLGNELRDGLDRGGDAFAAAGEPVLHLVLTEAEHRLHEVADGAAQTGGGRGGRSRAELAPCDQAAVGEDAASHLSQHRRLADSRLSLEHDEGAAAVA